MNKILRGVEHFLNNIDPDQKAHFATLAKGQQPEVLIISCADSRVDPNLFTSSRPGDVFHLRNAGNIVPPYSAQQGAEAATIEYAVAVLKIPNIVVCGHTDCGAMKAVLSGAAAGLPSVRDWLKHSENAAQVVNSSHADAAPEQRVRALIEENVMTQLLHLRTHPAVAVALAEGRLSLFGWVYEVATGELSSYHPETRKFEPMRQGATPVPAFTSAIAERATASAGRG